MYVSYPEAARSKLCSTSDIRAAVEAGALKGDDVFVVWDEDYEQWVPDVSLQRVAAALNARRFDSKYILPAVSSKPVAEVHEMTSRSAKELNGYDWFVIPVTRWNLDLLLGLHDGYHDAQVYGDSVLQEIEDMLDRGERVYQRRIGLTADDYPGCHAFPSQVATVTAAAFISGESEESVLTAYADGLIRVSPYAGQVIVHLDSAFQKWRKADTAEVKFVSDENMLGVEFEPGFWSIG